jgi:hypothetical protein
LFAYSFAFSSQPRRNESRGFAPINLVQCSTLRKIAASRRQEAIRKSKDIVGARGTDKRG